MPPVRTFASSPGRVCNTNKRNADGVNLERSYQICQEVLRSSQNREAFNSKFRLKSPLKSMASAGLQLVAGMPSSCTNGVMVSTGTSFNVSSGRAHSLSVLHPPGSGVASLKVGQLSVPLCQPPLRTSPTPLVTPAILTPCSTAFYQQPHNSVLVPSSMTLSSVGHAVVNVPNSVLTQTGVPFLHGVISLAGMVKESSLHSSSKGNLLSQPTNLIFTTTSTSDTSKSCAAKEGDDIDVECSSKLIDSGISSVSSNNSNVTAVPLLSFASLPSGNAFSLNNNSSGELKLNASSTSISTVTTAASTTNFPIAATTSSVVTLIPCSSVDMQCKTSHLTTNRLQQSFMQVQSLSSNELMEITNPVIRACATNQEISALKDPQVHAESCYSVVPSSSTSGTGSQRFSLPAFLPPSLPLPANDHQQKEEAVASDSNSTAQLLHCQQHQQVLQRQQQGVVSATTVRPVSFSLPVNKGPTQTVSPFNEALELLGGRGAGGVLSPSESSKPILILGPNIEKVSAAHLPLCT